MFFFFELVVFFFELVLKKARHGSDSLYGLRASDWHGPGVLWGCVLSGYFVSEHPGIGHSAEKSKMCISRLRPSTAQGVAVATDHLGRGAVAIQWREPSSGGCALGWSESGTIPRCR